MLLNVSILVLSETKNSLNIKSLLLNNVRYLPSARKLLGQLYSLYNLIWYTCGCLKHDSREVS